MDSVITIGGQSFIDGFWRLLGPPLDRLTNPLPLTLPGFTNSFLRVTNIVPVFPGSGTVPAGGLEVAITLEVSTEALLQVQMQSSGATISLGTLDFNLNDVTGRLNLSGISGSLSDVNLGGTIADLTGSGQAILPAHTQTISDLSLSDMTADLTGGGDFQLPQTAVPLNDLNLTGAIGNLTGTGNFILPDETIPINNLALGGTISSAAGSGSLVVDEVTTSLENIDLDGSLDLTGGTGSFSLVDADDLPLDLNSIAGTIELPSSISVPGLPIPGIAPVALDLTQNAPLFVNALIPISISGPSEATRQSLLLMALDPTVNPPSAFSSGTIDTLTAQLQSAIDRLVAQLEISDIITQPTIDAAEVTTLLEPVPQLVADALEDALTFLLAETGRLVFPPSGPGASCDVVSLPTVAEAQLEIVSGNGFELQVGFSRTAGSGSITFPPANPDIDTRVLIDNGFLLSLLCCLVEKLPNFSLPVAATTGTTDINGAPHLMCCTFRGVTAQLGPVPIGGALTDGISVCIAGTAGSPKRLSIVGSFSQTVPNLLPGASVFPLTATVATISAGFTLPIVFDLDETAALSNLREGPGGAAITASVTPTAGLLLSLVGYVLLVIGFAILTALAVGFFAGPVVGPIIGFLPFLAGAIIIGAVYMAFGLLQFVIRNGIRLLLQGASLLKSPVALPPGILEAFGRLAPVTVTIDDLEAKSVTHTPTSVWGLMPRIGFPKRKRPGKQPPVTHVEPRPDAGREPPTTSAPSAGSTTQSKGS